VSIAVLAWGSVTWNPRELVIEGDFNPVGPDLRLEFARVSRDGRLTLVIDELIGASCSTFAARSGFDDLDEAIANLWSREGSGNERLPANLRLSGRVGFVDIASGERSAKATARHPQAVESIRRWGLSHNYGAVIWTALASNFREERGRAFSVDAALVHLAGLPDAERNTALDYIRKAPLGIQTPVRAAVNERWPLRDG
jgi:hypothetical protein